MRYKQKVKYFVYGVIATAVLVPLLLKAKETIKLTFQEGDVLSASVMNAVLDRIENATSTLKADDLVGTWTVTQIVPYNGQPGNGVCRLQGLMNPCTITGTVDAADGMTRSRTDTVTITKTGSAYTFSQSNVSSFVNAHTNLANNGNLSVIAETIIFKNSDNAYSYYYAKKKSAEKIVLQDIQSASNAFNILVLDKTNTPPAPADGLTAAVNGTSVALAWADYSNDEAGFKVQYKTSATGNWTTSTTTAANASSYIVNGLAAGTYWFRVIATNNYGDAVSSSEVQGVVR